MPRELPLACRDVVELQQGVISRSQATGGGMGSAAVGRLVRSGRWQPLHRGVYLAFTGEPSREAVLWAALRRAGVGAMLSHQTAAEVSGLADGPSSLIHVTIPGSRRVSAIPGIVVHRSNRAQFTGHPSQLPPRTRIEETVLDLAHQSTTFDAALGWVCAGCQRRLTTAERLRTATGARKKLRWRGELTDALGEVGDGVHSVLEYRYVRQVERPHGLPGAARQARISRGDRHWYLDNLYADFLLCVELDGRDTHSFDRRWLDIRRDNAAAAEGLLTLRYDWADVTARSCRTAAQIAAVLQQRGWTGKARRCGPRCAVR
jgi:hypothetical protein